MHGRKRTKSIITNNKGASLIFVLAVMALLMAIGASALNAAVTNRGVALDRKPRTQAGLYADDLQRTVMYSLQTSSADEANPTVIPPESSKNVNADNGDPDYPATLGGQILGAVYTEAMSGYSIINPEPDFHLHRSALSIDLSVGGLDSLTGLEYGDLIIDTSQLWVNIEKTQPAVPGQKWDEDLEDWVDDFDNPIRERVPQSARFYGRVTVTVTTTVDGYGSSKSVTTVSTYEFRNDSGVMANLKDDGSDERTMLIDNAGIWEMISYERTEGGD